MTECLLDGFLKWLKSCSSNPKQKQFSHPFYIFGLRSDEKKAMKPFLFSIGRQQKVSPPYVEIISYFRFAITLGKGEKILTSGLHRWTHYFSLPSPIEEHTQPTRGRPQGSRNKVKKTPIKRIVLDSEWG
jgi:hypothetical protein